MRITNVMAVSLDGKIASYPGETDRARRAVGFTNDDDREHLKVCLKAADAVVVGASSVIASGSAAEILNDQGVYPIWAVLTKRGLPPDSAFLKQARLPRWLVSPAPLSDLGSFPNLKNIVAGARSPAVVIAEELQKAKAQRVLLFGGAEVNQLFYKERLVDELILTVCPLIVGGEAAVPLVRPPLPTSVSLTLVASQAKGNLVFLTYKVQKR